MRFYLQIYELNPLLLASEQQKDYLKEIAYTVLYESIFYSCQKYCPGLPRNNTFISGIYEHEYSFAWQQRRRSTIFQLKVGKI
jgi:hypothetical protein